MNRKIKLSPREAMLLESFKADHSYKEAARELNITVNTVQGLAKRLYYKLDAKDKLDAVLIGLRSGLISLSLIFSIIGGLADGEANEMYRGSRSARRSKQSSLAKNPDIRADGMICLPFRVVHQQEVSA